MLRFRWITFDRFKVVNLSRFYRVNFIRPYWVNFTVFSTKEYYLQPCDFKDEARNAENLAATINYIKSHPKWKLSLQTQKILSVR